MLDTPTPSFNPLKGGLPFPMIVMTVDSVPSTVVQSIVVPLRATIVLLISSRDVSGDKEVLVMRRTVESLIATD